MDNMRTSSTYGYSRVLLLLGGVYEYYSRVLILARVLE
jgi:hypothetical protein